MPQLLTAQGASPDAATPAMQLPFTAGARPTRRIFSDVTSTLGTTSVTVGPVPLATIGYLRRVILLVELSGGAGGSAVASADGLAGVLANVRLSDAGGSNMVELSGWGQFVANKYLPANPAMPDPRSDAAYSAIDSNGNGTIVLAVPVEVSARDGLGSLANQSASQRYHLEYTIAAESTIFATSPATTTPTVRVRAYVEAWTPPPATAPDGRPVQSAPPAHGTVQFVREVTWDVESGRQELRLPRVGNLYRAIILTARNTSGARSNTVLPTVPTLSINNQTVDEVALAVHRGDTSRAYGLSEAEDSAGGPDTGVLVWQWDDDSDGIPGWGSRRQFLPTTQSTDLRIIGDFGAAGRVWITTVDVAPAGSIISG